MQSLRFKTLLPSAILFIQIVVILQVPAFAAEETAGQSITAGAGETTTATESSPGTWDKTKEVSGDVWDATKEGSAKTWNKTKEVSGDAWDATKEGSAKAWNKTKEVSGDAWDATKEGSTKAWNKTKELMQPDAEEAVETPQPNPQDLQP